MTATGYMPHVAAIVNPRSGGGRTGRGWRLIANALEKELGPVRAHFTAAPSTSRYLPAAELTREALRTGAQLVIAVGGDGTISEVVNGFFENGEMINPDAHLAILNTGTGGDFRKTFELPEDLEGCISRIGAGDPRQIDLGRMQFTGEDGAETIRYFNNIASFGLSGEVVRAVNSASISKIFGGAFAFLWATLATSFRYKTHPVRLVYDDGTEETHNVGVCAVSNGKFFGGGMKIAPDALPDDGKFDVVTMRDRTCSQAPAPCVTARICRTKKSLSAAPPRLSPHLPATALCFSMSMARHPDVCPPVSTFSPPLLHCAAEIKKKR